MPSTPVPPPPLHRLALETLAPWEALQFALMRRLRTLPRGDGAPVLLIPGFGASDWHMQPLTRALRELGHDAHSWQLGRNLGMRAHLRAGLTQRIQNSSVQRPVTLIGWSLGGVFAREFARAMPERIARVITLGSPINGDPRANRLMPLFRLANRGRALQIDREALERRKQPPPVPSIAIYSKGDGLVSWRASLEMDAPRTRNIELRGTHLGLVWNWAVLREIAVVLASVETISPTDGENFRKRG